MSAAAFPRGVLVVGSGLLGASLGLALRRHGVTVHLADRDPDVLAAAQRRGAGSATAPAGELDLAVVAVPPAVTGAVVADLLERGAAAYVTDVASVKALPAGEVRAATTLASRYLGGHPMAGREVSGPDGALPDLFEGRPWVLCPGEGTDPAAVQLVEALVRLVGAQPVLLGAREHDEAVALVSHAPHLVAALVAARLAGAPEREVRLAGPGVTDVTRVAAGDPGLWTEILRANAPAVRSVLAAVRADLDRVLAALAAREADELTEVLRAGVEGRRRLPGKHGTPHAEFVGLPVVVADRPGQLARLFADAGAAGVNVEDVRIEHVQGIPTGVVEIAVRPGADAVLAAALRRRGWTVHR